MTPADIKARVAAIAAAAGDDERAHGMEDELWRDVLAFIATGGGAVGAHFLAQEALETTAIDFQRWCA